MPNELTNEQVFQIFGPDPDAPAEAAPETPKEPNTEAAPKQDDNPAEAEAEVTEEPKGETVDNDLERAWAALERDGWSKADLKRMSVDRIKELGAKRAKNHEDVDSAYKDLKSLKEAAKKAEKPEPVLDRAAEPSVDLSEALKAFEAEFGPESRKAFEGTLKPLIERLEALQKAETTRQAQSAQSERTRLQAAFSEVYPELAKPAVWDAVIVVAQQKVEEGAATADDALKAALVEVYGDRKAQPKAEPKKAVRAKDVPEAPNRAGTQKPLTQSERELKALELIEGGATPDDARKVLTN